MKSIRMTLVVSLAAVCLLAWASAGEAAGDKVKTKGVIISRTGETLIVSAPTREGHYNPHR